MITLNRTGMRYSIRNKLLTGFFALFLVLLITVLLTLFELSNTKNFADDLGQKTLPTVNAIQGVNLGLQASLASLRGWMLTSDKVYKKERTKIWQRIKIDESVIDQHISEFDNTQLSHQWKIIQGLLTELYQAQNTIEAVANSDQENKSMELLKNKGLPNYARLYHLITNLINMEKQQSSTDQRKKLLADMADFRGALASVVGDVRLYVNTGDRSIIQQINDKKAIANQAEQAIQKNTSILTVDQSRDFRELQQKKTGFFNTITQVVSARQAKNWNKANYLLITEAAPRAQKIQQLLGDLSEGNQKGLANVLKTSLNKDMTDLHSDLNLLIMTQWVLLVIAIILSLLITWLTSRAIVKPIRSAIEIASRIMKGDREFDIHASSNDESTDLIESLAQMHDGIYEAEKKLKYSEAKVKNLLDDLQKRIKNYGEYISAVSKGDLTQHLDVRGEDDLAKLGHHLNEMTSGLATIATQIVSAANEMASGLAQLESAASSQAASASEQATSVTEVSSVVEEIRTTSQQTLDKAKALGESAEKTHEEGEKGKSSVHEMSETMESLKDKIQTVADTILGLSDQTQKIGEITDVVSDIAKQSKMLALNASIEAAKAGEAGKGFSVVAQEVKELAEKSQSSTERVQQILQDIRQTAERAVMVTEDGTKQVGLSLEQTNAMGTVMNALSDVIQTSSMASQQIVAAVRQESAGIDQVVTSMTEIDKVTNQFSSATEQTQTASQNLSKVAEMLKNSVSVYKLSEHPTKGEDSHG